MPTAYLLTVHPPICGWDTFGATNTREPASSHHKHTHRKMNDGIVSAHVESMFKFWHTA